MLWVMSDDARRRRFESHDAPDVLSGQILVA
jgi:hypothetical protein